MSKIYYYLASLFFALNLMYLCSNIASAEARLPIVVNEHSLDDFAIQTETATEVPLRSVAEALGYTVIYYPEYKNISIEDSIQRAILHEGSKIVIFQGKLKIINLSRQESLAIPVRIDDNGKAYVSAKFFEAFFNDVSENNHKLFIDTQRVYLDNTANSIN